MATTISGSPPRLDPNTVHAVTEGAIDVFDYVDALPGLFPHRHATRVPQGAPLVIGGWAVDPVSDEPPSALVAVVDGTLQYPAQGRFGRYDVKALLGMQTPEHIGFRVLVPTELLQPGAHEIRVYALGADGTWYDAGRRAFWLYRSQLSSESAAGEPVRIRIDDVVPATPRGPRRPVAGIAPRGDVVLLSGWAIDTSTRRAPAGICALDDAGASWSAPIDIPRPDVRAVAGAVDDGLGFEIVLPTGHLDRGAHEFTVFGLNPQGKRLPGSASTTVSVGAPYRSIFPGFARRLAAPARCAAWSPGARDPIVFQPDRCVDVVRGAIVPIEGWVAVSDDELGDAVFLELHADGVALPARYFPVAGYRRQRIPPAFQLPLPPHEDAWFSYALDTSNLAPQTYRLCVAVLTADDSCYALGSLGTLHIALRPG